MSNDRPGRLPSLRGPRDLTLGGVRKKTFTPNIPVRKDRNKRERKDDQAESKPKQESKKGRQKGRGRGRGRGRPEIIQSHSIFEAGPSAEPATKRNDTTFGTGGGGGGAAAKDTIEKPSIKHEIFDEDLERSKTEEALKNLEGNSDFIEDLESDDTLLPTCLPMSISSWPPGSVNQLPKSILSVKQDTGMSDFDCGSIFTNYEVKQVGESSKDVLIFQLPDTLPIIPPESDDIKDEPTTKIEQDPTVKVKQEPGTKQGSDSEHCTLDQLSEGYVGKLQVMKSGQCRLIMGGIVLDLNAGTPSSFLEELVSVHLPSNDEESTFGDIAVLGNVSHKIICSPDMEHLIKQSKYDTR